MRKGRGIIFCGLIIMGLAGCSSAPTITQIADNTEFSFEEFYPLYKYSENMRKLPNDFSVRCYITGSRGGRIYGGNMEIAIFNDLRVSDQLLGEWTGPNVSAQSGLQARLEQGKEYIVFIHREGEYRFEIYRIDGLISNDVIAQQEAAKAEAERLAKEERERPRFSPEGQEYVKRTLIQAVGESRNQTNRGKTLFFESSRIKIIDSSIAGQYLTSDILESPNNYVLMEFYGSFPKGLASAITAGMFGWTILYRIEISQIGTARFVIDSFKE